MGSLTPKVNLSLTNVADNEHLRCWRRFLLGLATCWNADGGFLWWISFLSSSLKFFKEVHEAIMLFLDNNICNDCSSSGTQRLRGLVTTGQPNKAAAALQGNVALLINWAASFFSNDDVCLIVLIHLCVTCCDMTLNYLLIFLQATQFVQFSDTCGSLHGV